jgi:isoleucyl-tRNA synthetase
LGKLTVALDTNITTQLKEEGIAREIINRIQNLRKELNFEVTDKIKVTLQNHELIAKAVENNLTYICAEILASTLFLSNQIESTNKIEIEQTELTISIDKN